MLRRLVLLLLGALVLVSCRLDVEVEVIIEPDGTGTVTITAVADEGLVGQVDGLAEALVFDDAIRGGWEVEGPDPTDEGAGLRATFSHRFSSAQELANILNSIGPPLRSMQAGRTTEGEQTTNAVRGTLLLDGGFEAFTDDDLTAAVGGLPFGDRFAATGLTPEEAMSFTLRVTMPGEVISATGVEIEPQVFEWTAPLDGSQLEVAASTVQRPPEGGAWAGPLATAALVALIVWLVLSGSFIVFVLIARARRARRRRRRRPPAGGGRAPSDPHGHPGSAPLGR